MDGCMWADAHAYLAWCIYIDGYKIANGVWRAEDLSWRRKCNGTEIGSEIYK